MIELKYGVNTIVEFWERGIGHFADEYRFQSLQAELECYNNEFKAAARTIESVLRNHEILLEDNITYNTAIKIYKTLGKRRRYEEVMQLEINRLNEDTRRITRQL